MASRKVAVVTGANKGIGLATVKALCKLFDGDVVLTARDEGRGQRAVQELTEQGLSPKFHQLDTTDSASRQRLRDFLKNTYGGLDVLVNNAGCLPERHSSAPLAEMVTEALTLNYHGTKDMLLSLLPLLRPHARVVNVSTTYTMVALHMCSEELQARLKAYDAMAVEDVDSLMQEFLEAVQAGNHTEKGWPDFKFPAYAISKMGVDLLTFVLQRQMESDPREDVIINACCPGHCQTDLSGKTGTRSPEQGSDTPVYCALLPPHTSSPRGEFVAERKVQTWREGLPSP